MSQQSCPMLAIEVLDAGFLENRARLLEIAAFLDRIERAGEPSSAKADFRYVALRRAIQILDSSDGGRAKAIHISFSDPTSELLASAQGLKGACGAWKGTST